MSGLETITPVPDPAGLNNNFPESEQNGDQRFLFSEERRSHIILLRGYQLSRSSMLLSLVCGLLLIVCLLLTVWCGLLQSRSPALGRQCHTPGCLRQAAEAVSFLNRSATPCGDFYEYACGRFDEVHPLGLRVSYDVFEALEESNRRRIEQLLMLKEIQARDSALRKARVFYQTCVNSFYADSSAQPLVEAISRMGGWSILANSQPESWSFYKAFEETREMHGLRLFFSISWVQKDRSVIIARPLLSSTGKQIYSGTLEENERAKSYRKLIAKTLASIQEEQFNKTFNCTDNCLPENVADDILRFENKLALLAADENLDEPENVSLDELSDWAPKFQWPHLLNRLFGGGIDLNNLLIRVTNTNYIRALSDVIESANASTLNNYILWNMAKTYLPALGPRFAVMAQELDLITTGREPVSRKNICYSLLQRFMSRALRALFVIGHIGEENVPAAAELYRSIKQELGHSFWWMTEASRREALQVLERTDSDFGHSSWMTDERQLDSYYSDLVLVRRDFFDNMVRANAFRANEVKDNLLTLINANTDDDSLWVSGRTVDVEVGYNPIQERLIIPPGALQVPLFSRDNPEYANIAALGSVILKELARPFFVYHQTLRRDSWWDELSDARYQHYKRCLVDSFQGYTMHTREPLARHGKLSPPSILKVDPNKVLNYIQAHHLSFILSHNMFKKSTAAPAARATLPGMENMTSEQLFFLIFTQSRCQSTRDEFRGVLYSALKQLPHREMINNFVYNSPAFVEAYQCSTVPQQHLRRTCKLDSL